jgi:MFS family permease
MMPASMALIGQAYPDPARRTRAVATWAMGGAVASTSGPILGGLLTLVSWRLIFLVNVPVVLVALLFLSRAGSSDHHRVPFDRAGQAAGILAMGALTFAAIEAGDAGLTDPRVIGALAVGALAAVAFAVIEKHVRHPMVPPDLVRSRTVLVALTTGFAFMVGYYGLPFVMSLFLQQVRALTSLATGLVFLPMMLVALVLTPLVPRVVERLGARRVVSAGFALMSMGLVALSLVPTSTPVAVFAALMVLVGLAGPTVAPTMTTVLLSAVPAQQAGTASGLFNTSRQLGGALAVAVFGALLTGPAGFESGMRFSLLLAALVAVAAAVATAVGLRTHRHS